MVVVVMVVVVVVVAGRETLHEAGVLGWLGGREGGRGGGDPFRT